MGKKEPQNLTIYFFHNAQALRIPERIQITSATLQDKLARKSSDKKHYEYKGKLIYNFDGTVAKDIEKVKDEAAFVLVHKKSNFKADNYQYFYESYIKSKPKESRESENKKNRDLKSKTNQAYVYKPCQKCDESQKSQLTPLQKFKKWISGSSKPESKKHDPKNKIKNLPERPPLKTNKPKKVKSKQQKKVEVMYPNRHCCMLIEIQKSNKENEDIEQKRLEKFFNRTNYKVPRLHNCDCLSSKSDKVLKLPPNCGVCPCSICRKKIKADLDAAKKVKVKFTPEFSQIETKQTPPPGDKKKKGAKEGQEPTGSYENIVKLNYEDPLKKKRFENHIRKHRPRSTFSPKYRPGSGFVVNDPCEAVFERLKPKNLQYCATVAASNKSKIQEAKEENATEEENEVNTDECSTSLFVPSFDAEGSSLEEEDDPANGSSNFGNEPKETKN